jgi:hypothetical protein
LDMAATVPTATGGGNYLCGNGAGRRPR